MINDLYQVFISIYEDRLPFCYRAGGAIYHIRASTPDAAKHLGRKRFVENEPAARKIKCVKAKFISRGAE